MLNKLYMPIYIYIIFYSYLKIGSIIFKLMPVSKCYIYSL